MQRLSGKVAVITGGAGGIGSATARLFAREGAKVLLVDLNEDALKKTVAEIDNKHVSYHAADVSLKEDVRGYVQVAQDRFGTIDVFFANAGIAGKVMPLVEYPDEDYDRLMAVNVRGVWLGLKHVIPVMQAKGGGSIMITSSVAGMKGFANLSAYVTSKHAIVGMMRTVALEEGKHGIRVNTINPGPVDNNMMRSIEKNTDPTHPEQIKAGFEQITATGRYCTNEEIAHVALFLASDESSNITGSLHPIDGGITA